MTRPTSVVLRGTGSALPARVFTNDEFVRTIDTSDEWIRTRTGIRERRFAEPSETAATLGTLASRRALEAAEMAPADVDMIICATITPPMMSPATACTIQASLGCRHVPAFDLAAACTGFVYGLSIAEQFIRGGVVRNALVIGSEVLSRAMDFTDRNTCILFGDGAGAAVVAGSDQPGRGLSDIRLSADGSRGDLILAPAAHTVPTLDAEGNRKPGDRHLWMHGREVFKFAVQTLSHILKTAVAECAAAGRPLDWVVPHQVNQRIINSALEYSGFPADRVMVNLDRYGNTSAASLPIALDELLRSGRATSGQTLLLVGFGGGLTWGSGLLTL